MILPVFSISIPIYRHKQPKRQYLSIYRGQLLEKIGWTPGNGLGLNQNGITTPPVQINYHNSRQGLGYENTTPMDISERMENEQSPALSSSHPSFV